MLQRIARWMVVLSGLSAGMLLGVALVYFATFALGGGLQTDLATDAPPEWALAQYEFLSGIVVLYLLAAAVFTVSLAVVQLRSGPWWAVVGGLCALVAGAGLLMAGVQATQATYETIDLLGFLCCAGYMVATNLVGVRAGQFKPPTAGLGVVSALLLIAATLAGGLGGAVLFALAVIAYGAWAVWLAILEWRQPAGRRIPPAPLQAVLQAGPGDPV